MVLSAGAYDNWKCPKSHSNSPNMEIHGCKHMHCPMLPAS